MPLLLFHIAWMASYIGEAEVHPAGFDFVGEEGYGYELLNFKPVGEFCYGYVRANANAININRLGATADCSFVDNVTVVWTAPSPNRKRLVVGWYRDARVYRQLQHDNIPGRRVNNTIIGFYTRSLAANAVLVPSDQRDFEVPYGETGLPGQSSVFYPEESTSPEMIEWRERVETYISGWTGTTLGRKWPSTPDAAHNADVEAAAIAFVRQSLGHEVRDRQRDWCGWDLEFARDGRVLCIEVKGLSGSQLCVELSPNEYTAMKRAIDRNFPEGDYRLAVVCNALTEPQLFLFTHEVGDRWLCELTSKRISVSECVGARASELL